MTKSTMEMALEQGKGVVRLAPAWVPRSFCIPGKRIKLHPDDYYALGGQRGGIDERWLSSTTPADNGPLTSPNEGLSFIVLENGSQVKQILFKDAVEELKGELIGSKLWDQYHGWPMFSKFFDNQGALPHHIHHRPEHAKRVHQRGKPESYYFPPQLNNHPGDFPYTFFGLQPSVTPEQVLHALKNFDKGDNRITQLSVAYQLRVGTGWDVPPGILHAPGSLCTYEPQAASDVFAMYQSLVGNQVVPAELLWKDTPPENKGDYEYLLEIIDWQANIDPHFAQKHFMEPLPVFPLKEMQQQGYIENWISYKSSAYSAKELTVFPGKTVTLKDIGAYGMIMMQGHGKMGVWEVETPALIRYGQLTRDEFFVSEKTAREGVTLSNLSKNDPLVMLKHFGIGANI